MVVYLHMSADKQGMRSYAGESVCRAGGGGVRDVGGMRYAGGSSALGESGELSVNHLADIVDKSPAAVSQHLAKLRLARIVATRQDAQRSSTASRTSTRRAWSRMPSPGRALARRNSAPSPPRSRRRMTEHEHAHDHEHAVGVKGPVPWALRAAHARCVRFDR